MRPRMAGSGTHAVCMLEFQNHVRHTIRLLNVSSRKNLQGNVRSVYDAARCVGYKEKGERTAAQFTRRVEAPLT